MAEKEAKQDELVLEEVHLFRRGDRDYLFSVPTCAFWEVDGPAREIVRHLRSGRPERTPRQDVISRFGEQYGDQQVSEVLDELVTTGILHRHGEQPRGATRPGRFPDSPLQIGTLVCHVSHDCNMRCTYCYGDGGSYGGPRELMSSEMARQYVDLLFDHSGSLERVHMTFFGGEPLINMDAIRRAVLHGEQRASETGRKITFSLTTNGTLVDRDVARFLDEHRIGVSFSVDGPKEVHDANRVFRDGRGTYDKVREALSLFEEGRPIGARVTMTRRYLLVSELVPHLLEMGFVDVGVAPVNCADTELDFTDEDLAVFHEECVKVGDRYRREALEGRRYGFSNLTNLLHQLHTGQDKSFPCGAGIQLYAGDPTGRLYMCHRLVGRETYRVGDVENGIDAGRQSDFLRRVNLENKEGCSGCWARYVCSGGCYYIAELHHGDPSRTHTLYCDWLRKWYEYGIGLYHELLERNPSFLKEVIEPRQVC